MEDVLLLITNTSKQICAFEQDKEKYPLEFFNSRSFFVLKPDCEEYAFKVIMNRKVETLIFKREKEYPLNKTHYAYSCVFPSYCKMVIYIERNAYYTLNRLTAAYKVDFICYYDKYGSKISLPDFKILNNNLKWKTSFLITNKEPSWDE